MSLSATPPLLFSSALVSAAGVWTFVGLSSYYYSDFSKCRSVLLGHFFHGSIMLTVVD